MLVKVVSKLVMPVGSSIAQSTVFNQTVKCHQIRQSVVEMMHSTPSSQKPVLVNTFQELYSLILSQPLSMRLELVHTDNYSTQNSSSQVKKMLPIILLVVTTLSVKKSLIFAQIVSVSQLITVPVFKDSWYSTQLVEELDQDQDPFYLNVYLLIMVRNPSLVSQFIHHHKSQPLLLNHITQFYQPTHYLSIPMLLLCLITKLSMISAVVILISKDQPIQI